jgi:hypothetical protein
MSEEHDIRFYRGGIQGKFPRLIAAERQEKSGNNDGDMTYPTSIHDISKFHHATI